LNSLPFSIWSTVPAAYAEESKWYVNCLYNDEKVCWYDKSYGSGTFSTNIRSTTVCYSMPMQKLLSHDWILYHSASDQLSRQHMQKNQPTNL
jgi:hypothetical protein